MEIQTLVKIVGKEIEKGWFSKKYILFIQSDKLNNGKPIQRTTSMEQYYSVEIGSSYNIFLYSSKSGLWYFHEEEALNED